MTVDTIKKWEADRVDVPSTTVPEKIAVLRGGETITITSKAQSQQSHYIGSSFQMTVLRSYELEPNQSLTLTLPYSFGKDNVIEIYALATQAGDDICLTKLFGEWPSSSASS